MSKLQKIFLPVFALLLAGCEKEIDFKYRDIEPIPVIEAALTPEGATASLTYTTPMDEPMDRSQIAGATVSITDLTDNSTITLLPSAEAPDGPYVSATGGIEGHRYRIEVALPDRAGTNTAECEMLPAVEAPELTMAWIKMPYDRVAVLQVRFPADPERCYWVRVYRNGEAYMWRAVSGNAISDGMADTVFMTTRKDISKEEDDTILVDGDVLTVTVAPVSRQMHDYLEAIGNDSSGPRLFAGPMALGYFLAAPVSTSTYTFHPATLPDF